MMSFTVPHWVRAAAVLLFVFALGALSGVAFERHHASRTPARTSFSPRDEHAARMAELRDYLELDDEQVARIEAVLHKHREAVHRSWQKLRPEVQSAMHDVHNEIAQLLPPSQRKRFHEWLLERHEEEHGSSRTSP
jgi:Spy/CpxP family protein refolding chaperone